MSSILDEIVNKKLGEVAEKKLRQPVTDLEKSPGFQNSISRSLSQSLNKPGTTGIIAEFKRKSPSKGWFKEADTPIGPVVKAYNDGAAGISVLTDEFFFGGNLQDLATTKKVTDLPVLRKDFIVDQWQLAESKANGADVVLLIAACLTAEQVRDLASYARSIDLETLLEIHNEREIELVNDDITMIGVNNRDLNTFEVNIQCSLDLVDKLPRNKPAISESGITDIRIIQTLRQAGFSGFLIGENFMKEKDPGSAFQDFIKTFKNTQ